MSTKKCTKCYQMVLLKNFTKNKTKKSGYCSWCKACHRESTGRYNQTYPGKNREAQRKFRINNREKANKASSVWRRENAETNSATQAAWYINNRDKVLKRAAEYYKNNREKCHQADKTSYEKNKRKRLAYKARLYLRTNTIAARLCKETVLSKEDLPLELILLSKEESLARIFCRNARKQTTQDQRRIS